MRKTADSSVRVCKRPGQCDRVCCAQDSGQFCEGVQRTGTVFLVLLVGTP